MRALLWGTDREFIHGASFVFPFLTKKNRFHSCSYPSFLFFSSVLVLYVKVTCSSCLHFFHSTLPPLPSSFHSLFLFSLVALIPLHLLASFLLSLAEAVHVVFLVLLFVSRVSACCLTAAFLPCILRPSFSPFVFLLDFHPLHHHHHEKNFSGVHRSHITSYFFLFTLFLLLM